MQSESRTKEDCWDTSSYAPGHSDLQGGQAGRVNLTSSKNRANNKNL